MCLQEYVTSTYELGKSKELTDKVAQELSTTFLHRLERVELLMAQRNKKQVTLKVSYCELFIMKIIQDIVSHNIDFAYAQKIYSDIHKLIINGDGNKTLK